MLSGRTVHHKAFCLVSSRNNNIVVQRIRSSFSHLAEHSGSQDVVMNSSATVQAASSVDLNARSIRSANHVAENRCICAIDENAELSVAIAQAIVVSQAVTRNHGAIRCIADLDARDVPGRRRLRHADVIASEVETRPVAVCGVEMTSDEVGPVQMHAAVRRQKRPGTSSERGDSDRLLARAAGRDG